MDNVILASFGFDKATDDAVKGLGFFERRKAKRLLRGRWRFLFLRAAQQFAQENGQVLTVADEDDDTPILDFWQWLIEGERIIAFLERLAALLVEVLPIIISMFAGREVPDDAT